MSTNSRKTTVLFETLEGRRLMSVTDATADFTFLSPANDTGGRLGVAIAASGANAVIGSYLTDVLGAADAGVVRVYDGTTGALVRTLRKTTPRARDYFGQAVAADEMHILVGATSSDEGATDAGAAYLFDAATGVQLATFVNPTPAPGDQFGSAVGLVGQFVLIGAKGDDSAAFNAGAAYLFTKTGTLLATYISPNPAAGAYFGNAVAGWNGDAVIGSYYDNRTGLRSGTAYVYSGLALGLNWTPLRIINNPTPAADDHFGVALAVHGDTLVVGAEGDDTTAANAGAAYQFDLSSGALVRTLHNPTPAAGDYFGWSIAVRGDRVVVGASSDDTNAANSGAAYVFSSTTGALTHTLLNPTAGSGDNFGAAVAFLDNDTILVGATGDDNALGIDAGAAYEFILA